MRVLLPALVAASPRTGVATYLRGLAGAWNRLDSDMCDVIITEVQNEVTSSSGNGSPDGTGNGSEWSYQLTSPY